MIFTHFLVMYSRGALIVLLWSAVATAFVPPSVNVARFVATKSSEAEETAEVAADAAPEVEAEAPAPEPVAPPAPVAAPTPEPVVAKWQPKQSKPMVKLPDSKSGSEIRDELKANLAAKEARIAAMPGVMTRDELKVLATTLCPAVPFWDPLGLSDGGFWNEPEVATIGFLRQAEIKHGRVAMAGFVGFLVHAQGWKWGFPMTLAGDPWPSADSVPALWDKLPQAAKWQIILFVGALEWYDEYNFQGTAAIPGKPKHYMRGGMPGKYPAFGKPLPWNLFDPFNFSGKRSEEQKAKGRLAEINNGRLAMIGMMGFVAEARVPGSVPALKGLIAPYAGNVMMPFQGDFSLFGGGSA